MVKIIRTITWHCYFATKTVTSLPILLLIVVLTSAIISFTGSLPSIAEAFSEKGSCKKCHILNNEEAFNILKDAIPALKILKIIDSPVAGLWEIDFESQDRKGLVYIDYTKKFIFAGSILDVQKKKNLTEARFSELNRVDLSKIPLEDAFVLGKRDAKFKVIVFDDPD